MNWISKTNLRDLHGLNRILGQKNKTFFGVKKGQHWKCPPCWYTIFCSLVAAAIWNPKISHQKSHRFTASLPSFLHSWVAITSLSPVWESPELRSILKSAFPPNGKPSRVTNFHFFISSNIIHQTPNSNFSQWDSFNSQ